MTIRQAAAAALLIPLFAASGCIETVEPVAIQLQFEASFTKNDDGSCEVIYAALANGIGTAEWERVIVRRGTTVLQEYVGARTAEFWGSTTLTAGQRVTSVPLQIPAGATSTTIEIGVRMGGPERTINLTVNCSEAG